MIYWGYHLHDDFCERSEHFMLCGNPMALFGAPSDSEGAVLIAALRSPLNSILSMVALPNKCLANCITLHCIGFAFRLRFQRYNWLRLRGFMQQFTRVFWQNSIHSAWFLPRNVEEGEGYKSLVSVLEISLYQQSIGCLFNSNLSEKYDKFWTFEASLFYQSLLAKFDQFSFIDA